MTWTHRNVQESGVYLVLNRYMEYIIKYNPRNTRQKGASRQHCLTLTMPLPPQKVLLTVTQNKILLIDLTGPRLSRRIGSVQTLWTQTGSNWTRSDSCRNQPRSCHSPLRSENSSGGDRCIMSQQMIAISEELDGAGIRVMFDDTDVFVLLLHFYRLREMCCSLTKPLGSTCLIWI